MANCVRNISSKNYQNLILVSKLQSKMSGLLFETQCRNILSTYLMWFLLQR